MTSKITMITDEKARARLVKNKPRNPTQEKAIRIRHKVQASVAQLARAGVARKRRDRNSCIRVTLALLEEIRMISVEIEDDVDAETSD